MDESWPGGHRSSSTSVAGAHVHAAGAHVDPAATARAPGSARWSGLASERGSGTLEHLGVVVVAALLVTAAVTAVTRADVGTVLACELRRVVDQSGSCGQPIDPTYYGADGPDVQGSDDGGLGSAAPGDGKGRGGSGGDDGDDGDDSADGVTPARYANASDEDRDVDEDQVAEALDDLRDALDGGFWGVRGGNLADALDAVADLDGPELDALVAAMSDDELRHWVDQMEDGRLFGGWSREQRRKLWEVFAQDASKETLDRLAQLTDELQPAFDDVGGDDARDNPTSPANAAGYAEVDHELFVGSIRPEDVSQGMIGDCWWIASMMAVAQADPSVIRDAITANDNGTYTVQLWDDGERVDVTVTPEMVLMPDGRPAFVGNDGAGDPHELWPMVLEKALALHYGDFEDIEGGWPGDGMAALTGRSSTSHDPDDLTPADLARTLEEGGAVGVGSLTSKDAKGNPYYAADADPRLYANHAYYVQSVDVEEGTVTLVNPWGIAGHPPVTLAYEDYVDAFRRADVNEVS